MIGWNNYLNNKNLKEAEKIAEERSAKRLKGTNQEQLGRVRFQDIADERYQSKIENITGEKVDLEEQKKNALEKKESMDLERNATFLKKWD